MARRILIGLIGDPSPEVRAHAAIPLALKMAGAAFGCDLDATWFGTAGLRTECAAKLAPCDGLWCVPGSPYADMAAALEGIAFARTKNRPFLGTCGGFQHVLIEYARNVLGLASADHAESNALTDFPLIAPLSCSLVGAQQTIHLLPSSRVGRLNRGRETLESFHCNYGLNRRFESLLQTGPLHISGKDAAGEVRVIELESHPFFVATLFQPELKAFQGILHPFIGGFVETCLKIEAGAAR